MSDKVYTNAKILDEKFSATQGFELGAFVNGSIPKKSNGEVVQQSNVVLPSSLKHEKETNQQNLNVLMSEIKKINVKIESISSQISDVKSTSNVATKDIDAQVVQAIKDLKQYASFFEKATFQMEEKILKTSFAIAKKIINIELGENSSKIAEQTVKSLLDKVKTSSKVTIHLNPRDYEVLKDRLQLDSFIELREDLNVNPGGVVIASDLGNFDGNVEAKISSILETLDIVG